MKFFTLLLISVVAVCYAAEEEVPEQEQVQAELQEQKLLVAPPQLNLDEIIKKMKECAEKIQASANEKADKVNQKLEEISGQLKDLLAKYKAAVGPKAVELKEKFLEIAEKIYAAAESTAEELEEKLVEISEKLKRATFDRLRDYINKKRQEMADKTTKLALEVVATCSEKTEICDEDREALRTGDFLKQDVDETSKLFIQCYFEGLGFVKDGKPQLETIVKRLGSVVGLRKVVSTLIKCRGAGGETALDKTFNDYTCFFNNNAVILK